MKTAACLRVLLVIALTAGVVLSGLSAARAQDDDLDQPGLIDDTTWRSPQFGVEITWDEDEFESNETDSDADGIALRGHGASTTVSIVESHDTSAVEYLKILLEFNQRDDVFDVVKLVRRASVEDTAWFAYIALEDGVPYVILGELTLIDDAYFILVQGTFPLADIVASFAAVQAGIQVEGEQPYRVYWDADTIAGLDLETISIADKHIPEDTADLGFVDAATWQSPQFGIEVTWDTKEFDANLDVTTTSADTGVDRLTLAGNGAVLEVSGVAAKGSSLADYLDVLADARETRAPHDDVEMILTERDGDSAWYAYTAMENGRSLLVLGELTLVDDEYFALVQLLVWLSDLDTGFAAVHDGIEIDGDRPFTLYWDDNTIADLDLGNTPPDDIDDKRIPEEDRDAPPRDDDDTHVLPQGTTEVDGRLPLVQEDPLEDLA